MIEYPLVSVTEGKTEILVPDVEAFRKSPSSFPPSDAPVFYNKEMELNRDWALATLRVYQEKYAIGDFHRYCEPMAGTGVRSVRVANEIPNLEVIINDKNPFAVELIAENLKKLNLQDKVQLYHDDANELMVRFDAKGERFDVLDVDPFGSPAPFLDASAQVINKNGLLAITSTDMATMCGVYPKACIRKYASKPIHSYIAHELAVRIMIGSACMALARHGKGIKPFFSHSTKHYIRTYLLIEKNITKAKDAMDKLGFISHCQHCYSIDFAEGLVNSLEPKCPVCGKKRQIGGPYWIDILYNFNFVKELQQHLKNNLEYYGSSNEMSKMIDLINQEVRANDTPKAKIGFYDLHQLADKLNLPSPKLDSTIGELEKKGFLVTKTHFRSNSIKTDAPIEQIEIAVRKVLETQFAS
ncbi:MAG: tRNA (guanine(10)-N(2))-dimethyltransferase [Asgard group archaeon]|nr:tRNA (guanine(10)-N(2))-dimethyltransferase [Asgard group archaeon]